MKKLSMFQKFDFNAFITGKEFCITGVKWNEHKNCVSCDVTITADSTDYGDPKGRYTNKLFVGNTLIICTREIGVKDYLTKSNLPASESIWL